jgi:hypothetical protein
MRRKRLKKQTENLFLRMCPRIYLGNHERVCITKLLKSLYPNVEPLLKSRRLLLGLSCVSLGLWVWVLTETVIFLVIFHTVQTQNSLLEVSEH